MRVNLSKRFDNFPKIQHLTLSSGGKQCMYFKRSSNQQPLNRVSISNYKLPAGGLQSTRNSMHFKNR